MVTRALIVQQGASLALALVYPWLAARKDAIQIEANGSLDTLKQAWHGINVQIRVAVFSLVALMICQNNPLLAGAYFALAAALHWLIFDYRLNTLRGLDPWYQGQNAASDKWGTKRNKLLALFFAGALYWVALYWFLIK